MQESYHQFMQALPAEGAAYLVDLETFATNVSRFLEAFRSHYAPVLLGYSYKTNHLPALCRQAHRLGCYAEVVSGFEYQMALRCGVSPDRIIFNGPVKTDEELALALDGGAMVNLDSLEEVKAVGRFCGARPDRNVSVGLRCGMDLIWKDRVTRFGFSDANGDLDRAAAEIQAIPNCRLAGLHHHFSWDRSIESFTQRARRLIELADRLFPDRPPDYLDLGGGFCGPMPPSLTAQIGPKPSYEEYGSALAPLFAERYASQGGPQLILEPGVGLVADTMRYVCRVVALKRTAGSTLATTTGSVHHLKILPNPINLPMRMISADPPAGPATQGPVDLVGFTCLEHDLLYCGYDGPVRVGDLAVFENVGAYSFVSSPTAFIRPTPPILQRDASGPWRPCMRQDTIEQVMERFDVTPPTQPNGAKES